MRGCELLVAEEDVCMGKPSRHSAAQTIVPPGFTTCAAAEMPFTDW